MNFYKNNILLQVKVVCETRDWEHAQELRADLLANYRDVVFNDIPLALSSEIASHQSRE